ncbi:MAG: STAS domain-containing protein [Pirellulaceae bacterium]
MFKRSKQGAINVITGEAPITTEDLEVLSDALEACLADGQPRVVLDLQEVPLIDSAGLELLLDVQEDFEQRAGTLKLAAPNPLCNDIMQATGVANHFEIYREVKTALGSFLQ